MTTSGATNRPPSATTDSVRTDEGVGVWFRPLDNDSDPDGDGLTVTSITQPRNGTASEVDNEIFYRPDAGFNGYDSLTYQVSDGRGGTDSGVAQIFVVDNEPPSAVDDRASTEEGVAVTVDVLANDSDPEGGPLTVASYTQPGGGSVSRSGDDLRFVPTAGYTGTATFTYTVEDDQGQSDTASVTVTVTASNAPPSATNDAATVQSGGSVFVNLLANDSDPDGDSLSYQIMSSPTYGTVSSVDAQTVQYTHVPGRAFSGSDSFTYRAVDPDGAVSNTATVTITINRPPIATNDTVTTYSDVVSFNVITGSGTDAGTGNADYDPDGDALQITPISMTFSSGTGGTLTCGSNGACTWDPNPTCRGAYETISYTLMDGRGGADTATLELSAYLIC